MSSLKKKSFKAFGWDFIGRIGGQGIGFVISVILARLLTPDDFGLLGMITVVISLSAIFTDIGLGSALIQRKEVKDEHYGSVFYFNVVVGLFLALLLFFSADLIAKFYNRPEIKPLSQVMALSFIINSFGNVRKLWLHKNINYKIPTHATLLGVIIGGSIGITMAYRGFGVWSLVAQTLISGIVNNCYLYFATKWKPKLIFSFKALKELWSYGFNMFLSILIDSVASQLDKIIIGKLFTPATLGHYFRAKTLDIQISMYTSGPLMSVLFPVLSNVQDDEQRFKNIVNKGFHLLNFVIFFLIGTFLLCSKDIIVILFSDKWLPSVEYFQILVMGSFIFPLEALLKNILSSKGNSKAFLKLQVYNKIPIFIVFCVGFWFGVKGFMIGMILSGYIALFFDMLFAAKEMNISIKWFYAIFGRYFIVWVLLSFCFHIIDIHFPVNHYFEHLLIYSFLYSISYLLVCYLFKFEGFEIATKEVVNSNIYQGIKSRSKFNRNI